METKKRRQVEFVAFTHIPELGGWVAICQQRNDFNAESATGYKKQSYAGAYQLTFCEKAEEGEEDGGTCLRGAKEELDDEAALTLMRAEKLGPVYIGETELNDKIAQIYTARVPSTILGEIRTELSGTIKLIPESFIDSIVPLDREKDKDGVKKGIIAMFPDAIENLKKAFVWLHSVT